VTINISASLIEDFLQCRKRAEFRIHRAKSEQTVEMILGDIVHKALEVFWNNAAGAKNLIKEQLALRNLLGRGEVLFCEGCVDVFVEKFLPLLAEHDRIEKRFKIPLEGFQDVFIVGKMDRVSNGKVFDWKTSRRPLTNISESPQFAIYSWAHRNLYGEPSGVYYASLTNGSLVKYGGKYESILFGEIIPEVVKTIKSGHFIGDGIFRKACYRCQYKGICSLTGD